MAGYIDTLAKLGEAATDPPWEPDTDGCCVYAGAEDPVRVAEVASGEWEFKPADARFIAVSRNVWDELVTVVQYARRAHASHAETHPAWPCTICDLGIPLAALESKVDSL